MADQEPLDTISYENSVQSEGGETLFTSRPTRLDADQYMAEDVDGVTESLAGSGNLNYLALQDALIDDLSVDRSSNGVLNAEGLDLFFPQGGGNVPGGANAVPGAATGFNTAGGVSGGDEAALRGDDAALAESTLNAGDAGFNNLTVGSLGATSLNLNNTREGAAPFVNPDNGNGLDGIQGLDGSDGQIVVDNGEPGAPGQDGMNGADGQNGDMGEGNGGDTFIDINIIDGDTIVNGGDLNIDLGDITNDVSNIITVSVTEISEIVQNLDLTEVINSTTNLVTEVTNSVDTTVTNVTNNVNETVTNVVNNVTNILDPVFGGDKGFVLDLDLEAVVSDVTSLDLGAFLNNNTIIDISEIVDLSPVTDILGDTLNLGDLVVADLDSTINLFGGYDGIDNDEGDRDLVLDGDLGIVDLDVPLDLDIPLDGVEAIVGDIDLDLTPDLNLNEDGLDLDLAGAGDDLTDSVNEVLEGVGLGVNDGQANDTDLDLGLDTDLVNNNVIDVPLDVVVDPVEDLVGDVDLGLDGELDLLGDNETDNEAGDSDVTLTPDIDLLDNDILEADLEVPLDPLETLTGDIDLDLDTAVDVLGETADDVIDGEDGGSGNDGLLAGIGDTLSDTVEGILPGSDQSDDTQDDVTADGDIEILDVGADLLNSENTDNDAGDQDLATEIDLDLGGHDIIEVDLVDGEMDAVEQLAGDIDLDVNLALDLLNPQGSDGGVTDLTDNNASEQTNDDTTGLWPESTLPEGSGLLGGIDEAADDLGGALPAPTGDVVEGLGGLDIDSDLGSLTGGGLFG